MKAKLLKKIRKNHELIIERGSKPILDTYHLFSKDKRNHYEVKTFFGIEELLLPFGLISFSHYMKRKRI